MKPFENCKTFRMQKGQWQQEHNGDEKNEIMYSLYSDLYLWEGPPLPCNFKEQVEFLLFDIKVIEGS